LLARAGGGASVIQCCYAAIERRELPISKQVQGVAVGSLPDHCRRPWPGPDIYHHEDPNGLFVASDNRLDLIGLKLPQSEPSHSSIIEAPTPSCCSFQPTMHRIPGDSFGSSNSELVQTLDTEERDFIKSSAAVLQSIISCPTCRTECLPTSLALVATTLPPPGLVETIANNGSGGALFGWSVVRVWTADTLHGWWTVSGPKLMASN